MNIKISMEEKRNIQFSSKSFIYQVMHNRGALKEY